MKWPIAFSLEVKKTITPECADYLYAGGEIMSKFNFKCPDEKCNAQVTCANLDKPKHKRKRDPYYKVVGEHSDECRIDKDTQTTKPRRGKYGDRYSNTDEYRSQPVRLDFSPPSAKRPDSDEHQGEANKNENKARPSEDGSEGKREIQRSKNLSSLVDVFLANESMIVQLPDKSCVDIKELFIEINGQDISEFPDELRIYYGKAWINKRSENAFEFKFKNRLSSKELTTRPTSYLPLEGPENTFLKSKLDKVANGLPKTVFIASKKPPYLKDSSGVGYINIWCEGPEHLDYRI